MLAENGKQCLPALLYAKIHICDGYNRINNNDHNINKDNDEVPKIKKKFKMVL